VVRDNLLKKEEAVTSMHTTTIKVFKRRSHAAFIFLFFLGLSLFSFRDTVIAGMDVPHLHDTGNRHDAHSLQTVDAVIDLDTTPEHISAQTTATLRFSLRDREGKTLSGITVSHERILHVIVVSEDFTVFAHLHPEDFGAVTPEMIQDARFSVNYSFPKAGRYLIALDSAVHDLHFSKQLFIDVTGEPNMAATGTDFSRVKKSGDYVIRLTVPEHMKAGQGTTLGYFIEKDGKPVADLETYLAALMHLAVIKTDLTYFIHVHGEAPGSSSAHPEGHIHGTALKGFGPVIEATVTFPVKGMYQIFSEIKHQGKVIVTSFMVNIE
jgi:hypothetical protein